MRWWIIPRVLVILPASVGAVDLNSICHELYAAFQAPNLTYEDAGKIADHMQYNNCWPAMQGSGTQQTSTDEWTCASLAQAIAQQSGEVKRIFGVKPVDAAFCEDKFILGIGDHKADELGFWTTDPVNNRPDMELTALCSSLLGIPYTNLRNIFGAPPSERGGPIRVLHCAGTFYGDSKVRYFWLDRFPDGEEHWGALQ